MLSKNKIKLIRSLERKKNREESGLFLIEGNKMVQEALSSRLEISLLVCTQTFANDNHNLVSSAGEIIITEKENIRKASLLINPQEALVLAKIPQRQVHHKNIENELCIALDCIQDPGNMGTILRIADWFGISNIFCSEDTVDCFNPKVVQSSMGAILRTDISYVNLPEFISSNKTKDFPIYGTFLYGSNIYTQPLSSNGIIVMGNEGTGISADVEKLITQKLFIPSFSIDKSGGSESLNVAVATAICCSEFRRR